MWHPSRQQQVKDLSPVCVQAWFEMGSRLQSKIIQPKFMWRDAFEHNDDQKKITASTVTPHDVELLDIVRVLKPESINRDKYPFAKLGNSFVLYCSNKESFMFECTSQEERDRFVDGLKLAVARLASKIIIGDENVFHEFYSPWGQLSSRLVEQDQNHGILISNSSDESSFSAGLLSLTDSSSVELNYSHSDNSRELMKAYPVTKY